MGERGDVGDNVVGSCDIGGDGGNSGESGGSGGGNYGARHVVVRSGSAGDSGGDSGPSNDDGSITSILFRKAVAEPTRHARNQGIRKLQKCLSTSVSHYDAEGSGSGSFTASFPFHAQRSVDIRNYTTTSSQASLTSPNILTNTRQYSSFGSTTILIILCQL